MSYNFILILIIIINNNIIAQICIVMRKRASPYDSCAIEGLIHFININFILPSIYSPVRQTVCWSVNQLASQSVGRLRAVGILKL